MEEIGSKAQLVWLGFVRTFVPMIASSILTWLTTMNITVDPQLQESLPVFLFALFGGLYYLIVRFLEAKVSPKFGILLGSKKSPDSYSEAPKATPPASHKQ